MLSKRIGLNIQLTLKVAVGDADSNSLLLGLAELTRGPEHHEKKPQRSGQSPAIAIKLSKAHRAPLPTVPRNTDSSQRR